MQYLYIIKCQEFYKIGIANDIESRLAQLSTGNPYPLEVEIYYAFDNAEIVERSLHQRYKEQRQRGEWFNLSYEDKKNIHSVCLMLGGRAYEYTGENATEENIEEAEETDLSIENFRTELRMDKGEPRGVVLFERGADKKFIAYIGRENVEFEKYLDIYRNEHPNSKVLK